MAAYAAVSSLEHLFSSLLYAYDAAYPPPEIRNIYELASKELKGLLDFVERLYSRSRKRMSASLERLTTEILEFTHDFLSAACNEYDELVEKVNSLMEKLNKMAEEFNKYSLLEDDEKAAISSPSSSKMVGCRHERSQLKGELVSSFGDSFFYLIYGMAGIGKTTLAREVFEDFDISEWFECRAWVNVGLDRKPEEFTEAILAQLYPEAHEMVKGGDEEKTTQLLNNILIGKQCLIVLDDVWDNHKFEEYWRRTAVVGNKNGSRVLITSRIIHIDHPYEARDWYPLKKRLMNKDESWDLLREKGFVGGSCPPQLEDAGKKIAEKCDGLPLTIIVIADHLLKADESLWIDVAAKRKHQLFVDVSQL